MILNLTAAIAIPVLIISLLAEYIDSSLGMGFGTTLSPILLIFGFEPLQIVPAILMSELISGVLAGVLHNRAGNVKFGIERTHAASIPGLIRERGLINFLKTSVSRDLKVVIVIALFSVAGTFLSVKLALSVPKNILKYYIGIMVTLIGLVILLTLRKNYPFSWKKVICLSVVASFNKGISGGGYGPVVTGGQLLSGVNDKTAVGITSLAEGLTCAAGLLFYFINTDKLDFTLFPFIIIGSIISVPFSVLTVKLLKTNKLRVIIGVCTIILGIFSLAKVVIG
jgi:uncharacterized membrane protein YfcA